MMDDALCQMDQFCVLKSVSTNLTYSSISALFRFWIYVAVYDHFKLSQSDMDSFKWLLR